VSTLTSETTTLGYLLRFLPVGIGLGAFQSPNNSAIMGTAPRERLGVASGLLSITRTLGQTTGIAVLGALWASRVASYAGGTVHGGSTDAPAAAQVAGLHDVFSVIIVLIASALALSIWAFLQERRGRRMTQPVARPPVT
jgi:MFS family permease